MTANLTCDRPTVVPLRPLRFRGTAWMDGLVVLSPVAPSISLRPVAEGVSAGCAAFVAKGACDLGGRGPGICVVCTQLADAAQSQTAQQLQMITQHFAKASSPISKRTSEVLLGAVTKRQLTCIKH
jgi:hypothetical protein